MFHVEEVQNWASSCAAVIWTVRAISVDTVLLDKQPQCNN